MLVLVVFLVLAIASAAIGAILSALAIGVSEALMLAGAIVFVLGALSMAVVSLVSPES